MTYEELLKHHIDDTLEHKEIILWVGNAIVDALLNEGKKDLAIDLAVRCTLHDNSKFRPDETCNFVQLLEISQPYRKIPMSAEQRKLVKLHWYNNRHHPEHFADYHKMKELDIIEMCCDWCSRSIQYDTNFLEIVQKQQRDRFHFDDEFFSVVMKYCNILNEMFFANPEQIETI